MNTLATPQQHSLLVMSLINCEELSPSIREQQSALVIGALGKIMALNQMQHIGCRLCQSSI